MTAELIVRWAGGQINLMGWNEGANGNYEVEALADGTNWGNPSSVRRELRSAMRDGSRSVKDRDTNRTISLKLRVASLDPRALSGGEGELDRLDGRRCELVWTPPRNMGIAPSVFVVDYAELEHEMDDLAENDGERFWSLTLECLPHAYADEWITVPALVQGASTPTVVDAGSSTAGWTAVGGTLSAPGGKLRVDPTPGSTSMVATRTGAVNLTTDRYLTVRSGVITTVEVLNGAAWTVLPAAGQDGSYQVFDGLALADPTVDAIRFTYTNPYGFLTAKAIFDVRKQAKPRSTDGRQQIRAVSVPGSRRTPASLVVDSPTTGLGTVLIYAGPPYHPGIARGALHTRSSTSTSLSGTQASILPGASIDFELPANEFYPGSHAVWLSAFASSGPANTTGVLTTTIELRASGGTVITSKTFTNDLTYAPSTPVASPLNTVDLDIDSLPDDSTAVIHVHMAWAGTTPVTMQELLLFNRPLGKLIVAECGDDETLWIDTANMDRDHDMAFRGSGSKAAALPMSLTSELRAWAGAVPMTPGLTHLYVGTMGTPDSTVEATFRPAHHTHTA